MQIVNWGGGGTDRERYRNRMFNFLGDLQNAYVLVKYELWSSMLWKKLAMVKDFVIVQIVIGGGGVHTYREVWKGDVNFL